MSPEVRLRRCDLAVCEALCCHDGVWLTGDDELRVREAIRSVPTAFSQLPRVMIVGRTGARKTATRSHVYRHRPAHFTDTRCVFALSDGRCSLQTAAEIAGQPPWTWKPLACWLHPLRLGNRGEALVPPPSPGHDPDTTPDYAGYTTFTPCGEHQDDGVPWRELLAEEQAWFQAWRDHAG